MSVGGGAYEDDYEKPAVTLVTCYAQGNIEKNKA
jgi:hypothetical protein